MATNPTLPLNDGHAIPQLGLGTYELEQATFEAAIDLGYRHFDTAFSYGNEQALGRAIAKKIGEGAVRRQDLYIVSKLWCSYFEPQRVDECLQHSLNALQLDYIDLYLMHAPIALAYSAPELLPTDGNVLRFIKADHAATWKALESCVDRGLIRSIGVSNFNLTQLQALEPRVRIPIACNQIENHLYLEQVELIDYCQRKRVKVVAYAPLGVGHARVYDRKGDMEPPAERLLDDPLLEELACKYGKSAAQIAIRYLLERGRVVIPRTSNVERLEENWQSLSFTLEASDMERLKQLAPKKNVRYYRALAFQASPDCPF